MPALHRALALVEVDDVPLVVAEDLHLDVAWRDEQLLQVELPSPKAASASRWRLNGLAELASFSATRCRGRRRPPPP